VWLLANVVSTIRIVDYAASHREHFRALNLEWITRFFAVEEADRRILDDPEREIIRPGGCILMAERDAEVVGTCALIRNADGSFELAKMAVAESARGSGVGLLLGRVAIARAKSLGAPRIELLSNTVLRPAIALYRKLGFAEVPLPSSEYRRANIKMVLELHSSSGIGGQSPVPPLTATDH
jgi:GNAT superfamily N-acetyltransferase